MKASKKKSPKKKHIALMFWYGAEFHELKHCFKDTKIKLIRAKAKAQNLPTSHEQALDFLLELNEDALAVIRKWLGENLKFENERDPEIALEILKSLPTAKIDSDDFKNEWRSILSLYSKENPSESLIEFLQGKEASFRKSVIQDKLLDSPESKEQTNKQPGIFLSQEMIQNCTIGIKNNLIYPTNDIFSALITGVIAANNRDNAVYEKSKSTINQQAEALSPLLLTLLSSIQDYIDRSGLLIRNALISEDISTLDPELFCAVAQIRKTLPSGQFFANVIAMVIDQDIMELTPEQARAVYPLAGEIIAFPNSITGQHYEGELAIWRTERRSTDKQNKFVITSHEAKVYQVISVPHASSEPDAVREWLINIYSSSSAIYPIFQLSDGVLIRIPSDLKDPKLYKFENPLDLHKNLKAFELSNGRRIVIGPLPATLHKFDCAPTISVIKRLLKTQKAGEYLPNFTRSQMDSLTELIKAENDYPFKPSLLRAKEGLWAISDLKEQFDEVVSEMLSLPKVASRIEEEKKLVLQKFEEEQKEHQQIIKNLQDEKTLLNNQIAQAKISIKAQEQQLSKQIRARFLKAQEEGMETLAQSALFRGLIGVREVSDNVAGPAISNANSQIESIDTGNPLITMDDMKRAVLRASFAKGISPELLSTIICSARICGVVGLIGEKKTDVVNILSNILANGVTCSVSISVNIFSISDLLRSPALITAGSLTLGMPFGEFLEAQSHFGRTTLVEFIGSNRMPPESYLPELIDLIRYSPLGSAIAWTSDDGKVRTVKISSPVILLLSFVGGQSTFPMEPSLSYKVPTVPVDIDWNDAPEADNSITVVSSYLSASVWNSLEIPPPLPSSRTAGLNSVTEVRLSKSLENLGCRDSLNLALALLRAGRPGHEINSNEVNGELTTISKQFNEVMKISGTTLFAKSSNDARRS